MRVIGWLLVIVGAVFGVWWFFIRKTATSGPKSYVVPTYAPPNKPSGGSIVGAGCEVGVAYASDGKIKGNGVHALCEAASDLVYAGGKYAKKSTFFAVDKINEGGAAVVHVGEVVIGAPVAVGKAVASTAGKAVGAVGGAVASIFSW